MLGASLMMIFDMLRLGMALCLALRNWQVVLMWLTLLGLCFDRSQTSKLSVQEAAEVKHLIPVVFKVAQQVLSSEDPYDKLVLGALAGSVCMENVMDNCKHCWSLPTSKANEFYKGCQTLNLSLTQLGLLTHKHKIPLWNFTIKNHCLEHVSLQGAELSPRMTWNYGSESMLMHVRSMIAGKRSRQSVFALQNVVMEHWISGFEMGLKPARL